MTTLDFQHSSGIYYTALVAAGTRPRRDPLAEHFGKKYKSILPITGQPMLSHVLKALLRSPRIVRVIILTQESDPLTKAEGLEWIAEDDRIAFWTSGSSLSQSLIKAITMEYGYPFLVTTADHPLLTPEILEEFIRKSEQERADLTVGMVERETMIHQYPDNREVRQRTWLKFRSGSWSGCNLFAFYSKNVVPALELWTRFEKERKKPWKLMQAFGWPLLLMLILRRLTVKQALNKAGNKLGLRASPVALSQAEAAIDVDKLSDYETVTNILEQRIVETLDT